MSLNKLANFIKNTDGRTLYVNPADLNATDSISNQGTSLTEPFRTLQRALIEAARFSYVRGNSNDLIERTTILLYPGEHTIDNRPGYGIFVDEDGNAKAKTPSGDILDAFDAFNLKDDSNFDVKNADNVLHRFNSIYGGVILPRGTSIVGMDLRKTKIRPLYVPNPTDPEVPNSAIFRLTGTCYFWQFTIFDGSEDTVVFTDHRDFSELNRSIPTFSHHKLTAFEYADGANIAVAAGYELSDLSIYYSKLSNAYNEASGRAIDEKFPDEEKGFAPRRPEFEIVGSFATDPVSITRIVSGDGVTPNPVVTVKTGSDHGLNVGTPIKIRGVAVNEYNISTKVANIIDERTFTYSLEFVPINLPASPSVSSANVTVETDTVTGASPYIFNCSMRSVWGINGMHADGAKATGFRSMVVAQFTAISLQKDDRAFVKYNQDTREYDGINIQTVRGPELASRSSSKNTSQVYHLDPRAVYRPGWDTTHIKMSADAVIQIVSVFAIGFNQHFGAFSGADASITNSNSNFGQFALLSDGFKNDAFSKDDQGFITSIITPNNAFNPEVDDIEVINYINIDFDLTRSVGNRSQLYLQGFTNAEDLPPAITQGYRIGANYDETLTQPTSTGAAPTAKILMVNNVIDATNNNAVGNFIGRKVYKVLSGPTNDVLTLPEHGLMQGEKIRILSGDGNLPENVEKNTLYYCNVIDSENIRLSTSASNAFNNIFINIKGGENLRIESRVNDKVSGDLGHPVQYDYINNNWFIHTNSFSEIFQYIRDGAGRVGGDGENDGGDFVSTFERKPDTRSLDDKVYRLRYVIPKESKNAKPPTPGYVIQSSSTTGARNDDDFTLDTISIDDYEYNRNTRFIADCENLGDFFRVRAEKPHNLSVGDKIKVSNVTSTNNPTGAITRGFNGEFRVLTVIDARNFEYDSTDVNGFTRNPGSFTNDVNDRNILLPRFERKDSNSNIFVYRVEPIRDFASGIRDGIYHLFCVNGGNRIDNTFTDRSYNQPIEDFYPQLDLDNIRQNPPSTTTFAARAPLGRTFIDDLQNSLTRETIDKLYLSGNRGYIVDSSVVADLGSNTQRRLITLDRSHSFNGIYGYTTLSGGSGYAADGVFHNVALISSGSVEKGAAATVTVAGGTVTDVVITDPGSGYVSGETLTFDLAGGTGSITIGSDDIEINKDTVLQFTGGGANTLDFYALLDDVDSSDSTKFTIICDSDVSIVEGMYAYPTDSATEIGSSSYDSSTSVRTFTALNNNGIGLQRGNSFVVFDSQRRFLGKFYVKGQDTPTVMEAVTDSDIGGTPRYVGRCGLEDNDASTGRNGENIGVRGTELFGLGTFYLNSAVGSDSFEIEVRPKDGSSLDRISNKLFVGRYIKIGNELMRVASSITTGPNQNIVKVIRGALGTVITAHETNSKIRAIELQAIELRRPSILRASNHTFEYLGYGPGNYSTALPQLQVRQLSEGETYLVQSQELACGQVVYTAMSDNGDFYIGNTKYAAASGKQTTFDVPVPTIAGQEASSNNVVFDEMVVRRRLFVAGGVTNEVLSQFDGPVKFTKNVNVKKRLVVIGESSLSTTVVNGIENSSSGFTGALQVRGGVGVAKDVYVGDNIETPNFRTEGTISIGGDTTIGGEADISGNLTVNEDIFVFNDNNSLNANNLRAVNGNSNMTLFDNQASGDIIIGSSGNTRDVRFRTTKRTSGETSTSATAGVQIDGGLVVKDALVAKEFKGEGLGPGVGNMILWAGSISDIPSGFLLCDGRVLSTTGTYARLFAAIGYTYGGSGGAFRIPNLRDKFLVGSGGQYDSGDTGGNNVVTVEVENLPKHTHGVPVPGSAGSTPSVQIVHRHFNSQVDTELRTVPHGHSGFIPSTVNGGRHGHKSILTRDDINGLKGGHIHLNPSGPARTGNTGTHGDHTVSMPPSSGSHQHQSARGAALVGPGGVHAHPFASIPPSNPSRHRHTVPNASCSTIEPIDGTRNVPSRNPDYRGGLWQQTREEGVRFEDLYEGETGAQGSNHRHPVSVPSNSTRHSHNFNVPSRGSGHQHPVVVDEDSGNHRHVTFFPDRGSNHVHGFNTPSENSTHSHGTKSNPSFIVDDHDGAASRHDHEVNVRVARYFGNHVHPVEPEGGGNFHENRPPWFALPYIIQFR